MQDPIEKSYTYPSFADENDYSFPQRRKFRFRIKPLPANKPKVNIILFVLTVFSTYLTGGLWYALPVIAILFTHEMGHYLMCRKYNVPATLPFFIPFPLLNPFGTLGAVIQMRGRIPNRKALFDIGVAGPLAGLALSLPALYFGIVMSDIVAETETAGTGFYLGESLMYKIISSVAIGNVPQSYQVVLHPLAYAGWVGLFVTALNLLPIGQLDGGHVYYSMFGKRGKTGTYIFLAGLGVATINYPGWGLLFIILLFLGRRHPAPIDDYTPLDKNRRLLAYVVFVIFILCFIPEPFQFMQP